MNMPGSPLQPALSLRLFMHEDVRHDGRLLHEWLLELARHEGLAGGSVFRAVAGFGRHGVLHEQAFFELAGTLPLVAEFILDEEAARRMLEKVAAAGVELVYTLTDIHCGVLEKAPAP